MKSESYRKIVENYIDAYNRFDVDGMLKDMHEDVRFGNIANGEINLSITGISALREQAIQSAAYFKERRQNPLGFEFHEDEVEVRIAYDAILAIDLPNGPRAGERIKIEGRSAFTFMNGKIIKLVDWS
jgi:hypothetical protein